MFYICQVTGKIHFNPLNIKLKYLRKPRKQLKFVDVELGYLHVLLYSYTHIKTNTHKITMNFEAVCSNAVCDRYSVFGVRRPGIKSRVNKNSFKERPVNQHINYNYSR